MRYLAAIFEFWVRKGMFLDKRPSIHDIAVKYRCSSTELQKYIKGSTKIPQVEGTVPLQKRKVVKRKIKTACFDEPDAKNITPKKKLKIRKQMLCERLGVK